MCAFEIACAADDRIDVPFPSVDRCDGSVDLGGGCVEASLRGLQLDWIGEGHAAQTQVCVRSSLLQCLEGAVVLPFGLGGFGFQTVGGALEAHEVRMPFGEQSDGLFERVLCVAEVLGEGGVEMGTESIATFALPDVVVAVAEAVQQLVGFLDRVGGCVDLPAQTRHIVRSARDGVETEVGVRVLAHAVAGCPSIAFLACSTTLANASSVC